MFKTLYRLFLKKSNFLHFFQCGLNRCYDSCGGRRTVVQTKKESIMTKRNKTKEMTLAKLMSVISKMEAELMKLENQCKSREKKLEEYYVQLRRHIDRDKRFIQTTDNVIE